ncbi:MAG: bifunctional UDP-N-acetylmuramoyl-tripeptide:D-alanyl-D-alanine ligase/alanine racemase [Bacteroidales bacterium]|nr:bifunctional UDP-N-acetylmuramoyl-tripeptide:D-alanyl-D-alanine ligase/alanine racemase [Bacteroidales bacterium]
MVLQLEKLIEVCKATVLCSEEMNLDSDFLSFEINSLLFDSRRLNSANHTVFFAIRTANNDGHRYINELYEKGVRVFVCTTKPKKPLNKAVYLLVDDSLKALQRLATYARNSFSGNVIAIGGSNGKTIVKEWSRVLIAQDRKVCFSPRSYNSQIGVALSLWQLNSDFEAGIFEAGISEPNEMQTLNNMIRPDLGLFTNIGDAHGVNFSSIEEKINEKLKLFEGAKKLICPQDNQLLYDMVSVFCKKSNIELISYCTEDMAQKLQLPFKDRVSKENAVAAFVLCSQIGIDENKLKQRIDMLTPLDMRMQIQSTGSSILLNDCYSLDITSLEAALDYLNTQDKNLQRCVILSDLQEKSEDIPETLKKINTLLQNKGVDYLYGIGTDFVNNSSLFDMPHKCFESSKDFLEQFDSKDFFNKAILLKGSRKAELEKITNLLESQSHQSILKVNLTALDENVRYFKSKLKPGTRLMGMVKASSYGCGGNEVGRELQRSLADYLTVAFADEGVTLRKNGITLPIMVVTLESEALNKMMEYNLEPVVHNFETLSLVKNLELTIHIKLDTGMHRLGFAEKDLQQLIDILKQHTNLHIASIFSHFSCADTPQFDNYTIEQIEQFEQLSNRLCNAFDYKILRHICNSAGTIRFPQAHFDMVRLGIGMYGIGCDENTQKHLRYVQSLETRITEIRTIESGESVSYMRNFTASKPTKIGVIPIGYADGLNRHLSERGFCVWINGKKAPIVGNICMDMCMINLNDIDAAIGDRVVIFGEENPVENIAKALDTITYEVFTSISPRIKRIYYHE